jgi:hypothetical protein
MKIPVYIFTTKEGQGTYVGEVDFFEYGPPLTLYYVDVPYDHAEGYLLGHIGFANYSINDPGYFKYLSSFLLETRETPFGPIAYKVVSIDDYAKTLDIWRQINLARSMENVRLAEKRYDKNKDRWSDVHSGKFNAKEMK